LFWESLYSSFNFMPIVIATVSIFLIAGLVVFFSRFLPFKICPVCAGSFGTWLWMLIVRSLGYSVDPIILAILMGGSIVGIAYQIEKLPGFSRSSAAKLRFWKMLFVPLGFIAVYSAVLSWWIMFVAMIILLVALTLVFARENHSASSSKEPVSESRQITEGLEEKMKNCC